MCLLVGFAAASSLSAQSSVGLTRVALYQPAALSQDSSLEAVLSTMADSVELSLVVMQRYDVRRLPPADPEKDLARVRAYCETNHIDQAILGSGAPREQGGFDFRLLVYDRKTDSITVDRRGSSTGALDIFDTTDALTASLLEGLSGSHLLFGSLTVDTDPPGATVSVNGRDAGTGPLALRGLPVGTVQITARSPSHEDAHATVTIADGETASASLKLAALPGSISVITSPPTTVQLDNGDVQSTPYQFTSVAAGPHVLTIANVRSGRRELTAGEPLAVDVGAGQNITVSRELVPGMAHITIADAPPDSVVTIEGATVDSAQALATGIDVPAGTVDISVTGPQSQKWSTTTAVLTGTSTRSSIYSMTWTLPRRTVSLTGKADDWAGLLPIWRSAQNFNTWAGQPGTRIARGYASRDDTNLFLRFDFDDGTPTTKLSRTIEQRLIYAASISTNHNQDVILATVSFNKSVLGSSAAHDLTVVNPRSRQKEYAGSLSYHIGENMMEIAIPLAGLAPYLNPAPDGIDLSVANGSTTGVWITRNGTDSMLVDFGS